MLIKFIELIHEVAHCTFIRDLAGLFDFSVARIFLQFFQMRKPKIPQTDRVKQGFQQFGTGVHGVVTPIDGKIIFHNR